MFIFYLLLLCFIMLPLTLLIIVWFLPKSVSGVVHVLSLIWLPFMLFYSYWPQRRRKQNEDEQYWVRGRGRSR